MVLLLRPPLLSVLWLLSRASDSAMIHQAFSLSRHCVATVATVTVVTGGDDDAGRLYIQLYSLVSSRLTAARPAFVACHSIEMSDCRL